VAQRLAATLDAELLLLHVLPSTPLDTLEREERRAALRQLQAEHSDPYGASPETSAKYECERAGGHWHSRTAICEYPRR